MRRLRRGCGITTVSDPHPQLDIHRITAERKWRHWHHPFYGQTFYVEELRAAERSAGTDGGSDPAALSALLGETGPIAQHGRLVRAALFLRGPDLARYRHFLGDRRRGDLERRYLPLVPGLSPCITGEQDRLYRQAMPALPTVSVPLGSKPCRRHSNALQIGVIVGHLAISDIFTAGELTLWLVSTGAPRSWGAGRIVRRQ